MGRNARWRLGFALFYLVVTCLPPLSYAPNVVGLYDIIQGNYTYDPSSPWTNHFAATWRSPDPRPVLAKTLDQLIGKTGLDPLDPVHPLASYRVERVFPLTDKSGLIAQIAFQYSDHSTRTYRYLVSGREVCRPECGAGGWMYTDIDAFRAEHKALPGLTPVNAMSPLTLGTPQRLPIPYDTQHFDPPSYLGDLGKLLSTYSATEACWAPDGQSFLFIGNGGGSNDGSVLWHVALNGSSIQRVDSTVSSCAWGSSGKQFAYLRLSHTQPPRTSGRPRIFYEIVTVDTVTQEQTVVEETLHNAFAIAGDAIYYLREDATLPKTDVRLWRKTLDNRPAQEITVLTNAAPSSDEVDGSMLAAAPDGQQFVYRCGTALCLTDVSNGTNVQLALETFSPVAHVQIPSPASNPSIINLAERYAGIFVSWSHDEKQIAIVSGGTHRNADSDLPPIVWVVDKAGRINRTLPFDTNEVIYAPQWTPDDRFLVGPSTSYGGHRIVGIEMANGQVWDLTQPKWDAVSSLSPDGKQVLLWNGRGGFWTADLLTSPPVVAV